MLKAINICPGGGVCGEVFGFGVMVQEPSVTHRS